MKSETFRCPHCGTQLDKSAAAWVMGEADIPTDGSGIPSNVSCPACGGAISTEAMVRGKYDDKPNVFGPVFFILGIILSFFVPIIAEARYGKDIGFWGAVGIGFGLSFVICLFFALVFARLKKIFGSSDK